MLNTIPNLILLVSDYCWNEYKKGVILNSLECARVTSYNFGNGHERVGKEWDKSLFGLSVSNCVNTFPFQVCVIMIRLGERMTIKLR